MELAEARRFALSLPEVTEEPHFHLSSFRVRGKIFATVPQGDALLHVFVSDEDRELAVAVEPEAYETLWWGKKAVGVKVTLATADAGRLEDLLRAAWARKAPKRLARAARGDAVE
ncbi:MAG TPA: MmcQ/YjbR family DNA-binding protein [Gammaproteobacteria bacterium]|nr:MmcQ/YjbR family DNA-binding protein [Gammaproteobacteria bacterium]